MYAPRACLIFRELLCGACLAKTVDVSPDKPDDCGHENQLNNQVKPVKPFLKARIRVPFLAQLHADVGQARSTTATTR